MLLSHTLNDFTKLLCASGKSGYFQNDDGITDNCLIEHSGLLGGVEPPASVLQKVFQYGFRINRLRVVLVPIIFFGNLGV